MIQPGLERVSQLLKDVQFPWKAIHVAGTNGKGSICHHASSLLRRKLSRVGKFTSPHVVDRWDCISINGRAVNAAKFKDVETHYMQLNQRDNINASQYEILTATAFTLFNMHKVDVGVIEVGMGGKLDATNILNNQVISVISKIARDHEGFLGNTLEEIATHKAGILRPNVPYIVNPKNEFNVSSVIDEYAKEIGAGPRLFGDTPEIVNGLCATPLWRRFAAPLRPFQQDNAILAIVAVIETLNSMGITITHAEIGEELIKPRHNSNPGRFQYIKVPPVFGSPGDPGRSILVDGAHNPDAATALEGFVSAERTMRIYEGRRTKAGMPVTWVLAMTEGKDARKFLEILLRATDNIITTTFGPVDGMPWVKPMDPQALLDVARSIEPRIKGIAIPESGVLRALCAAKYITEADHLIVLTGSLYLGGDFQREMRDVGCIFDHNLHKQDRKDFWSAPELEDDVIRIKEIHKQEHERYKQYRRDLDPDIVVYPGQTNKRERTESKRERLYYELEDLQGELVRLVNEEHVEKNELEKIASEVAEKQKLLNVPQEPSDINDPTNPLSPKDEQLIAAQSSEVMQRDTHGDNSDSTLPADPEECTSSNPKSETDTADTQVGSPKIRKHTTYVKSRDRRNMQRPSFIQKMKGEA